MRSNMSLLGLYVWDPTILDSMMLPDLVDRETLIESLLADTAELEILYPEPHTLKRIVGLWSKKELPIWTKLLKTTMLDYDPISNYDRTEEWSDDETRDLHYTNRQSIESTETRDLESNVTGSSSSNASGVNRVAAFNDDNPAVHDTSTDDVTGSSNNRSSDTGTVGTDTTSAGANTDAGTIKQRHSGRIKGNIGVTTTQQMLEQERSVVKFNIYDYIIDDFKQRFCLLIY